jgi:cytoskeletal protein CcmA (bactofilin family)
VVASTAPASAGVPPPSAPVVPLEGAIRDRGIVRRDALRAASWSSAGVAKVLGDVVVRSGDVSGLVSIAGKLVAGSFRSEGTFEVGGTVEVTDQLRVEGTTHFANPVRAGDLTTEGTLRSSAPLTASRIFTATGILEAPAVRAGGFLLHGSAEIPGDVEAVALVRANFRGNSEIGTIRAAKVHLRGPPAGAVPDLVRSVLGGHAAIRIGRIEASSVELSAVDVEFVRAPEIVLGAGAHVTTVEGTVVRQHPSARVGFESRTPPPHGLRR